MSTLTRTRSGHAEPVGLFGEVDCDNFAGGGGASLGIERALGKAVDIAVNHDPASVEMHAANHPATRHLCEDVWSVDPAAACAGRPVRLAWFSPDCRHFSRAKGGRPVSKRVRGLAWVVIRWAAKVRPRIIMLENVEEFTTWGPLGADGRPCPRRKGRTFRSWVGRLRELGYDVQWRALRACDYGAPTIRKRLFLVARCDGRPIRWPAPTHGDPRGRETAGLVAAGDLLPWRTAAGIIDWSIPCPSIFERRRPLAEATMRRIAAGIRRFVIECEEPFIVPMLERPRYIHRCAMVNVISTSTARCRKCGKKPYLHVNERSAFIVPMQNGSRGNCQPIDEPLRTVTAKPDGGGFAVCAPSIVRNNFGHMDKPCDPVDEPLRTSTTQNNKFALVEAFLASVGGAAYGGKPAPIDRPARTVLTNDRRTVVTSHLCKMRGTCRDGQDVRGPMPTLTAGGNHVAEVRAFLTVYYGNERDGAGLREPCRTVTSKDRLALVTVSGVDYQIVDIGMRMLTPRELARAQGFPDEYVLTGTKTSQVARIGNSVPPCMAEALVRANLGDET